MDFSKGETRLLRKLQQYYIFKFSSLRLKDSNYNIKLKPQEARKNGELVSIGDSQMLRILRKLKNIEDAEDQIKALFIENKKIKRNYTEDKSYRLFEIEREIDVLLFCPDIVSVVINDNKHYQHMIDHKFFINNRPFVRLLCGAGNARRNTVIFCAEEIEKPLKEIMNNGRKDIPLVPAKFNAYFSLIASATLQVSEPYFCVIKDALVTRKETVDYIEEKTPDDIIETKEMDIEFNLFDGMGIISPKMAKIWAEDLELDYVPSAFIIRNAFMKGMVAVIDFHKFSDEIGKHLIDDIWGDRVNIRDMDVIITESQLKLWNAYDSCRDYIDNCRKNDIQWGISRVTPKEDKRYVFSNYQFLQVLDLDDKQIENLCSKTIDYFNKTILTDVSYALLYLLGKNANQEFDPDIFDNIHDTVTKALILNNELLHDPYVQNYLIRSMNKKIRESYIGNLILDGNYQIMISDPYAFMEHLFDLPVCGLLGKSEYYAQYWNKKGVDKVSACRAPLTWESEVNILDLQKNKELDYWYQYLNSGIVYNVNGNDVMLHADSDWDGDLVMTTNQKEFIDGAKGGLPVTYKKHPVSKTDIVENELYKSDMLAFDSRIGYITNCSTTMYAMLPNYGEDSEEYKEIVNRLKICRKEQGNEIDKTKGLIVKPFPKHWTRWNRRKKDNEEFNKRIPFYNSILVDKRPYFMRWLYSDYNRKYKIHKDKYDLFYVAKFGKNLDDILFKNDLTPDERIALDKYNRYVPLLDSNCLINRICHYMESKIKELKEGVVKNPSRRNIEILWNNKIVKDGAVSYRQKIKKMEKLYREYKSGKRSFSGITDEKGSQKYKTLDQYSKYIRYRAISTISPDVSELANLALDMCYTVSGDKSFLWNVFSDGLIENVMLNKQEKNVVPFLQKNGDILYLDKKYDFFEIDFNKEEIDINDYI